MVKITSGLVIAQEKSVLGRLWLIFLLRRVAQIHSFHTDNWLVHWTNSFEPNMVTIRIRWQRSTKQWWNKHLLPRLERIRIAVTPVAKEVAPSSYEHHWLCDGVMEGANQHSLCQWCRYGLYNNAPVDSVVAPPLVQKRKGRNKVKAAVRRSRQRSATGIARDKGNSYVIVSTICNIWQVHQLMHEGTLVFFEMRFVGEMS